ncbi:glutaredoxin family protein [Sporolactobacillus spathodeae]|uniref:Glutaredoxin n=1 Tax=Sporolactobacillus spathodeae TaxID=1465502 RepID=A0ABS2Q5R9_9BACL|nr:glutaredoxin [Sporolactobacillus spathodeae]MBM7657123.1 glutaredoxin [Sporolactobacillus spathodeae]
MTEQKKVLMITKQFCPYCVRAKAVLDHALDGKYNDQIETVVREKDEARFNVLKDKYQFLTVPTFVDLSTGKTLSDSKEETITPFMKEALG